MEASKNSGFSYKVNKIEPIKNISKKKLETGAKVENWFLVVCCGREAIQKVVVFPSCNRCEEYEIKVHEAISISEEEKQNHDIHCMKKSK